LIDGQNIITNMGFNCAELVSHAPVQMNISCGDLCV